MKKERVQKILSQAGVTSRRKAESMIREGSITINGSVAEIGSKAQWGKDAIKVNGKLLFKQDSRVTLAFYKPKGVLSAMEDAENRPVLSDYLKNIKQRVYPIGRMDFNSEGLLLLTNDGELAQKIQKNPQLLRTYHVKVKGEFSDQRRIELEKGAKMSRQLFKPEKVTLVQKFQNKSLIEFVVQGSESIDVKHYFEIKGFLVDKLLRVAVGPFTLDDLKPGSFKVLKESKLSHWLNPNRRSNSIKVNIGAKRFLAFEKSKTDFKKEIGKKTF